VLRLAAVTRTFTHQSMVARAASAARAATRVLAHGGSSIET
jgi:hypothetical protein